MKNLVIVESPTKARTLSQFLGKDFEITASMGHVRDLPRGEFGVDVEKGFAPLYVIPKEKIKTLNFLLKTFLWQPIRIAKVKRLPGIYCK